MCRCRSRRPQFRQQLRKRDDKGGRKAITSWGNWSDVKPGGTANAGPGPDSLKALRGRDIFFWRLDGPDSNESPGNVSTCMAAAHFMFRVVAGFRPHRGDANRKRK